MVIQICGLDPESKHCNSCLIQALLQGKDEILSLITGWKEAVLKLDWYKETV